MKYKIIVNPAAGKGRSITLMEQVESMLWERGVKIEFVLTKAPGDATILANEATKEDWQVIVSLGGDGTASEVIGGLVGSNSALGIIPCGTGNDFARSLGVPLDIEQAVNTLLDGKKRKIDIGWERDQIFANIASVGFPCEVARQATAMKRLKGSLAFFASPTKPSPN